MHPCELENSALAEGLVGTRRRGYTRRKARSVFNEREKLGGRKRSGGGRKEKKIRKGGGRMRRREGGKMEG